MQNTQNKANHEEGKILRFEVEKEKENMMLVQNEIQGKKCIQSIFYYIQIKRYQSIWWEPDFFNMCVQCISRYSVLLLVVKTPLYSKKKKAFPALAPIYLLNVSQQAALSTQHSAPCFFRFFSLSQAQFHLRRYMYSEIYVLVCMYVQTTTLVAESNSTFVPCCYKSEIRHSERIARCHGAIECRVVEVWPILFEFKN